LKRLIAYCGFILLANSSQAQYFLKGNVRDIKGAPLNKAKIYFVSNKQTLLSDYDGSFGLASKLPTDTIVVSLSGYDTKKILVGTLECHRVMLNISEEAAARNKPKLISFTKDVKAKERHSTFLNSETYFKLIENDFVEAAKFPYTGFSLNVNKASYSNVRRFINMGSRVPPDAVRVEEFLNYFNLFDDDIKSNETFKINSAVSTCPWDKDNKLLFLQLNAKKIPLDKIPPGNFVFLIDVSGSMDMPNRLPLIKEAFQLFVKNLRAEDKVTIVTYGGMVGTWLATTSGNEKEKINNSLELLHAAGDTPGEWGLESAYKMARSTFIPNGNNRIIIATDADFNVGETSEKALFNLVSKQRESGIFLTCLGVGTGNFKDSKLQSMAKAGNGNYAYLDNLREAEKVLVKELTETLYAVADNALINIQFNPSLVKKYRLIGFDNKKDAIQDTTSILDGGEVGSGSNMVAIFEIETINNLVSSNNSLGNVNLKYNQILAKTKVPKEQSYSIINTPIDTTDNRLKFATALTAFGLKLKGSAYLNNMSWEKIKSYSANAVDTTKVSQKEFLDLLMTTINIYEPAKKKKKKSNAL
jgi:Ca-activated chloride channel homolog